MTPHIGVASVDILNSTLAGTFNFDPHLNLISGENGTLKTRLLQLLKTGPYLPNPPGSEPRIQAINPLRNSQRREVTTIVEQLRQSNRTRDSYLAERLQAQMQDTGYQEYPSIGELFILEFRYRLRDGGDQTAHMNAVAEDFNGVIGSVFPEYRLLAEWDPAMGNPNLRILKGESNEVPLQFLSLGEQEVLSLITNLHVSRDANDVFLIDEPEVHLNWHLEERIFGFFQRFCERHDKQMIIVTHSRIVFTDRFLPVTTFFYWTDGRVAWGDEMPSAQRERIAGEAVEIIKLGDLSRGTFFVEDSAQKAVVTAIAAHEGVRVRVAPCGNSSNVRSLYKQSKSDGGWNGAFFLEDGDNQGSPFPGEPDFIHLEKYCIENYLLDLPTASMATGRDEAELRQVIFDEVVRQRDKILGKNKWLEFLFDGLQPQDLTAERMAKLDASVIIDGFLKSVGLTRDDFLDRYVNAGIQSGSLDSIFPNSLVEAIRQSTPDEPHTGAQDPDISVPM